MEWPDARCVLETPTNRQTAPLNTEHVTLTAEHRQHVTLTANNLQSVLFTLISDANRVCFMFMFHVGAYYLYSRTLIKGLNA
jgi:hypothetical protein